MVETLNKRTNYNGIDLSKFIAALLIVMVHCSPWLSYNSNVNIFLLSILPGLAVPYFAMCSGFFFFKGLTYKDGKIEKTSQNFLKLRKYVTRIVLLYASWSLVYLCWQIPEWYSTGWLSINAFIDYFISFFLAASYYHFWYIVSLIYATIAGYVLLSFIRVKWFSFVCGILFIIGLFTSSYSWVDLFGVNNILNNLPTISHMLWIQFLRTFLKILPLMFFGYIVGTVRTNCSIYKQVILTLFVFILRCIEIVLLLNFIGSEEYFSIIIMTVPCDLCLLKIFSSIQLNGDKQKYIYFRNSSTFIYCAHPLVINFLKLIPWYDDLNSIIKYICVAGITVVLSFVLIYLSKNSKLKFLKVFM